MNWWRKLADRIAGRSDLDLDRELRAHLDLEAEEQQEAGLAPEEARYAAQRAFGNTTLVKEEVREMWEWTSLERFLQDLRYAARMLWKDPGFTAIAVLSLALGIGANTAIFTLIDAVMLRSLPVRSPDELVSVGDASRPTALWYGGPMSNIFSYPLYQRLRDQNRVFTGLLASGRTGHIDVSVGDSAVEEVRGRLVSGNYFEVLGVSPVFGRTFSAEEDRTPLAGPVIVISYDYWSHSWGAMKPRELWDSFAVVPKGQAGWDVMVSFTRSIWFRPHSNKA